MNFDSLSLRVKLIVVIALIVSLASCPLLYFSYQDAYDRSMASAREEFETTAGLIDEGLQLSYLNAQTLVTEKVALEKEYLSEVLDEMESYLERNGVRGLKETLRWVTRGDTYANAILPSGAPLNAEGLLTRMHAEGAKDFLDFSLADYERMSEKRIGQEYFAFFRVNRSDKQRVSMLVGMRRTAQGFLMAAEVLDYLENARAERVSVVEAHLNDVVRSLQLEKGAEVMVLAGDGRCLAGRGEAPCTDRLAGRKDIYDEVKAKGVSTGELTDAGLLYSLRRFKPLDWYIQMTVPVNDVVLPARLYAAKLTAMVLAVFSFLAFFGMNIVTRVLRPLRCVGEAAGKVASVDFAQNDVGGSLAEITKTLPRKRNDEVGQVAEAFRCMTGAIDKKIKELKQSLARQHSLQGELGAAREIQQGMLTLGEGGIKDKDFETAASMQAAKAVGGDLYDALTAPDGRRVVVLGDVSGKGVSAALFMCVTLTLVRQAVSEGLSPATVMKKVNDQLVANNPNLMFVTLWIGRLDPTTGVLEYSNGGHCPPVIVPADSSRPVIWVREMSGPLVGALEDADFTEHTLTLEKNDLMLIYSDGVTEAMNERRQLFEEKRLEAVLKASRGLSPRETLKKVNAAVTRHRGLAEQSDDITMLAFVRKAAA